MEVKRFTSVNSICALTLALSSTANAAAFNVDDILKDADQSAYSSSAPLKKLTLSILLDNKLIINNFEKTQLDVFLDLNKDGVFKFTDDLKLSFRDFSAIREGRTPVPRSRVYLPNQQPKLDELTFVSARYANVGDYSPVEHRIVKKSKDGQFFYKISNAKSWANFISQNQMSWPSFSTETPFPKDATICDDVSVNTGCITFPYKFYFKPTDALRKAMAKIPAGNNSNQGIPSMSRLLLSGLIVTEDDFKAAENNGLSRSEWNSAYPTSYPDLNNICNDTVKTNCTEFDFILYNMTDKQKDLQNKYFGPVLRDVDFQKFDATQNKLTFTLDYSLDQNKDNEWKNLVARFDKIDDNTPIKVTLKQSALIEKLPSDGSWGVSGKVGISSNQPSQVLRNIVVNKQD